MIWIIILSVIFLIGVGLLIYAISSCTDVEEFAVENGGGLAIFLMLIGAGSAALCTNNSRNQNIVKADYTLEVENLNAHYKILTVDSNPNDIEFRKDVTEYNNRVYAFKKKYTDKKLELENPWENWFTCCAYADLNIDAVSYIQ